MASWSGTVQEIKSGDTLRISGAAGVLGADPAVVRLCGCDTYERLGLRLWLGQGAVGFVQGWLDADRGVHGETVGTDDWGRTVAVVRRDSDDESLTQALLDAGQAIVQPGGGPRRTGGLPAVPVLACPGDCPDDLAPCADELEVVLDGLEGVCSDAIGTYVIPQDGLVWRGTSGGWRVEVRCETSGSGQWEVVLTEVGSQDHFYIWVRGPAATCPHEGDYPFVDATTTCPLGSPTASVTAL